MSNWTPEPQPFGPNRAPLLAGLASDGSDVAVPVAVDPATGRLLVNATGGSAATSVAINDGVTTSLKATVASLTDSNPIATMIVDGNGDQITSFGGGTQYLNGAVQATPTGTVALGWDTANVRALLTNSSGQLSVLASAGTNLNTSLLALESGGNLATLASTEGAPAFSGATHALGVSILDASGNQITSFGGGTQYTDAGTPPTHPVGPTLEFNNAGAWATVGSATPLPVTITGDVATNLAQVNGHTVNEVDTGTQGVGIVANGNTIKDITQFGDGVSTGILDVGGSVYNGSTYDRVRSVQGLADSIAGVGLQGVGGYVYNGASWEKLRGDLGDASGATGLLVNSSLLYNGSTYDRARGDTTSGMWVNIKNASLAVTNIGTFAVQNTPVASASIFNGKTTVSTAGTRVTLASSQAVQSVTIKALSTNTGFIYVGNTSVASTNGLQLQANETVSMDVANLNTVNLDCSVSGEGVTYLGIG